ncbi:MAG: DinB family protein [Caldilineaceae bacterium]|nr:DinB family protein [Caldilineaceae bacterium]
MDYQAERAQITAELLAMQAQLIEFFTSVAGRQEWRPAPTQWSFRQVAWHLATTERACLLPRVQQIAAGTTPTFGIYLDTETEFATRDLQLALEQWTDARQVVIEFVQALPAAALAYTGYHPSFGRLTVLGYLQIFLAHDRRHLAELQQMAATG